jgi:hypothetical protein
MGARGLRFAVTLCLLTASLLVGARSVSAREYTHELLSSFGLFSDVESVAVDRSTGDVYVYDNGPGSVYRFNAAGEPVNFSSTGTNVIEGVGKGGPAGEELAIDESSGPAKGDIYAANESSVNVYSASGEPLGQLNGNVSAEVEGAPWGIPCGVAVDHEGNVYVGLFGSYVNKYEPKANPVSNSDYVASLSGLQGICNIAVDSEENVYAASYNPPAGGPITKYPASQFAVPSSNGSLPSASGSLASETGETLTIDPVSQDLYADAVTEILQYGPSGESLSLTNGLESSFGIAINASSGMLYAGDGDHVDIFGPSVPLVATLRALLPVDVGETSATARVDANPRGNTASYEVEYGTDTSYGMKAPTPSPGTGKEFVEMTQPLSGLQPATTYHYRFIAVDSEKNVVYGPDEAFTTYSATPVETDTCPNAGIRGLQSSSYLSDCRAYEMVSPVDKESANIAAAPRGMTQSSASGDAIKFNSVFAFGDAVGVGQRGAEYASHREAGGWVTHGIDPKQASLGVDLTGVADQYEALSADLSKGVYYGMTPVLAGHPNVEKTPNLYLRTDVLSAPPGSYALLSDSVSPVAPYPTSQEQLLGVAFGGASADFSHVIFESYNDLTPETSGLDPTLPKVYEWVSGTLRLAGILPDGTAAAESMIGKGLGGGGGGEEFYVHNWAVNTISTDGSRVVFEGPPLQRRGIGNSENDYGGNLYMRIDGMSTIQLNVSERTPATPGEPPATPEVVFEGATPDDSKVFFSSTTAMTDETSEGGFATEQSRHLYMYDVDAPAGKHLTLISVDREPSDGVTDGAYGVVPSGISQDGSYVYFTGPEKLLPGQVKEFPKNKSLGELFVWHDGVVRAITEYDGGENPERSWGVRKQPNGFHEFRVTPDGKRVLFVSAMPSTSLRAGIGSLKPANGGCGELFFNGPESELCQQVFLYDYETDGVKCISCDPTGEAPAGEAGFEDYANGYGATFAGHTQYLTRPMTPDGRLVFFDSPDPLVPQDTNGMRDVYEYDTQTGRVSLISSGTSQDKATFVDASVDGNNAFFTTRQQLVRADNDSSVDLYDARVDGGFLSQNVSPPAPCEGDDCQGPAKAAPSFSLPSSLTFAGAGNAPVAQPRAVVHTRSGLSVIAAKLAKALRRCHRKHGHARKACEAKARKRYRAASNVHALPGRGR